MKTRYSYINKILLSFFLIIILPLAILGVSFYVFFYRQSVDDMTAEKTAICEEIKTSTETSIASIEDELLAISHDFPFSYYSYDTDEVRLHALASELLSLTGKYDFLKSVYCYDARTKKVISTRTGVFELGEFYDTSWYAITNGKLKRLPVRKDVNAFDLKAAADIYKSDDVVTVLVGSLVNYQFVANISLSKLEEHVSRAYSFDGTDAVFSINEIEGKDADIDKKYDVNIKGEMYYGLITYTASYDSSHLLHGYTFYGRFFAILLIFLTVFMILLARQLAKQLYNPIERLYGMMAAKTHTGTSKRNSTKEDELSVLTKVFGEMNSDREESDRQISAYRSAVASASLYMYLEGNMTTDAFVRSGVFADGVPEYMRMCIIGFGSGLSEKAKSPEYKMNFINLLNTYLTGRFSGIISGLGGENTGILFTGDDCERFDELIKTIENAVGAVTDGGNFYIASGESCATLRELRAGYKDLLQQLDSAFFFEPEEHLCAGEEESSRALAQAAVTDSLINYETGLIRAVLRADREEIKRVFAELSAELKCGVSPEFVRASYTVILTSLDKELKFSGKLGIKPNDMFIKTETLRDCDLVLGEVMERITELFENNTAADSEYCTGAKEYMDLNYMKNIDVLIVCDALNISYPYLSRIFKEKYKTTLSDYLNNVRINKGAELLCTTALTVNEIAEKVGYNNIQSFQRFFKKITGVTPGDYRRLHKSDVVNG